MRGFCSALQHRDQLLPKLMAADREGILSMASHVKVNIRPVLTFPGLLVHDRLLQHCWGLNLKNNPMPGARERISSLRSRFNQLTASVTKFEARVTKQSAQLAKRNRQGDTNDDRDNTSVKDSADLESNEERANDVPITADDLEKEEQEIRELERKKRALEDRVTGMERDLGGLLR
ncbi:MAG: hypothetical protein Q9180_000215 [Flavoplaca navasiana]